jgi:hypothetical protein
LLPLNQALGDFSLGAFLLGKHLVSKRIKSIQVQIPFTAVLSFKTSHAFPSVIRL